MWRSAPGAAAHESLHGSPSSRNLWSTRPQGSTSSSPHPPPQKLVSDLTRRAPGVVTHPSEATGLSPTDDTGTPPPLRTRSPGRVAPHGPPTDSPYTGALPCAQFIRRSSSEFKKPVSSLGYFLTVKRCKPEQPDGRQGAGSWQTGPSIRALRGPHAPESSPVLQPRDPQLSSSGLLWRLHYMGTTD